MDCGWTVTGIFPEGQVLAYKGVLPIKPRSGLARIAIPAYSASYKAGVLKVLTTAQSPSRVRFGSFEVDIRSGEVWKNRTRLRLQGQPFAVLQMLLERRGEVVTREELKQRLWPTDTFVDFDDGLNTAVKKIRDLLDDSSDRPRYIETIPRRGYRFLAPVNPVRSAADSLPERMPRRGKIQVTAVVVFLVTAVFAFSVLLLRSHWLTASSPVRAIAVLPLQNLSGDSSQDYFAAGLTDALTTEVARAVGTAVRVTSRVSADKYRDKPLRQIAQELGVDAVVEGSVVRSGNRARITAQLIDARSDRHLWAATYDRDLHDLLSVESEIAATITRQVQIRLNPNVRARLAAPVPVDPEAYDLYLRGRYRAFSNSPQGLVESIGYLEQAVTREPNLAAAHALLARAYITQAFFVQPEEQSLDAKALDEVNRALELDPDLADAYLARGMIYWTHRNGFPHEQAIREIKHAVELDPNLAEAHHQLAMIFLHVGLLEKAEQELQTAQQLEPTNMGVRYRVAVTLLDEGKPQEAMAGLEGTRSFSPELWSYQMAFALFQLGRKEEAAALIKEYLRDHPRDQGGVGNAIQALLYADAGQTAQTEWSIQAAIQKGKDFGHFHHAAYTIGAAYALMNRPQDAMRWLRAAAEDGFPCYPLYEHDHSLDKLRQNLQFQQFMADMKKENEHYKAVS